MATRKEIQAAKRLLADTWRAANALPRRDERKPFDPSPGSFDRYIAWCARHKINPSLRWAFDTYYQSDNIVSKFHPHGAWPNSIEKMESLLGPGSPVHVPHDAPDFEQKQIRDQWFAVLRAFEPGMVEKYNYDTKAFEKIPVQNKTFSQQIYIEYSVFPGEHGLLHWEISCTARSRVGWGSDGSARVKFTPGVAGNLNETFPHIVSICDCRKITYDEKKAMTFSLVKYTYRRKRRRARMR